MPHRHRWLLVLSLCAGIAVLGIGVLLWQAMQLRSLASVSAQISRIQPYAVMVRLVAIGLLAIAWPRLATLRAGTRDPAHPVHAHWMALRWRVIGWCVLIELLLGQNLLARVLPVVMKAAP